MSGRYIDKWQSCFSWNWAWKSNTRISCLKKKLCDRSWKDKHSSEQEFCILSWECFRHYHCTLYVWLILVLKFKRASFFSTHRPLPELGNFTCRATLFCNGLLELIFWYWKKILALLCYFPKHWFMYKPRRKDVTKSLLPK